MTTRNIPILLQADLDKPASTFCYLLKIRGTDGTTVAVCSLDQDIDFDDGGGVLTYSAEIGLNQEAQESTGALDVDNSEATVLTVPGSDVTDAHINAGVFDSGKYNVYRINWQDPSKGHMNVMGGFTGAMKSIDGQAGRIELRGLSQRLKQSVVELYSDQCRAAFGSDGQYGCFFDAESLWAAGTIVSVDTEEPDRIFTATAAPSATGPNGALPFVPGLVQFLTGNNPGLYAEIEEVNGAEIKLRFPTAYDILATDTFRIRPDCGKKYEDNCIDHFDNGEWFRGEPYTMQGDEASAQMPGATVPIFKYSTNPEVTP